MSKKETSDYCDCSKVRLTFKQKQVLFHLAQGMQNKEIAAEMGLSVSTIKLHVSGILTRLNVKTRTAAVVKAQKLGLV